ncbi:MAG: hypothetical protein WEC75_08955 [Dehalococcoidia bacterium]
MISWLAACGGSGGAVQTPEPSVTQSAAEPPAVIEGTSFLDVADGYSVQFPAGWTADDDALSAGTLSLDTFFSPETIGEVQPNVSVTCERLAVSNDLLTYYDNYKATVERFMATGFIETTGVVAGQPARLISYQLTRESLTLAKTEAVLIGGDCAYRIALTAPPGSEGQFRPLFDSFLASFDLIEG